MFCDRGSNDQRVTPLWTTVSLASLYSKYSGRALGSEPKLAKAELLSAARADSTTVLATFSTLWPPSRHADVAASVCVPPRHPLSCPRAPLHGGDLLCASRLEPLLPHTPRDSGYIAPSPRAIRTVCGEDFARRVIGSDNG